MAPFRDLNLFLNSTMVKELEENPPANLRSDMKQGETRELAKIFRECRGNISALARKLELPRSTLVHRLKKFRLI